MSNNIVKYFISQENQKYESKYSQLNKKTAKRLRELYRNLSADEKIKKKKKNMLALEIKKMSNTDRERKKEYLKNYSYEII